MPAGGGPALTVAAANPGAWSEQIQVSVSHGPSGAVDELTGETDFHLTVEELAADGV